MAAAPLLKPSMFPRVSQGTQIETLILNFLDSESLALVAGVNHIWKERSEMDALWKAVLNREGSLALLSAHSPLPIKGRYTTWIRDHAGTPLHTGAKVMEKIQAFIAKAQINQLRSINFQFGINTFLYLEMGCGNPETFGFGARVRKTKPYSVTLISDQLLLSSVNKRNVESEILVRVELKLNCYAIEGINGDAIFKLAYDRLVELRTQAIAARPSLLQRALSLFTKSPLAISQGS